MTNLVEYSLLAKGAVKLLVGFPTSWECEAAFSQMSVIKTKNGNRLHVEPDIRVALSSALPRIDYTYSKEQNETSTSISLAIYNY